MSKAFCDRLMFPFHFARGGHIYVYIIIYIRIYIYIYIMYDYIYLWGGGTKARNIVVATRRSPKQWTQKSSEQRLSKVFCKVGFLLFPFFLLSCVGKVALVVC